MNARIVAAFLADFVKRNVRGLSTLALAVTLSIFSSVYFLRQPVPELGGFQLGRMQEVEFVQTGNRYPDGAIYTNSIALQSGKTVDVEMPIIPAQGATVCFRAVIDTETRRTVSYMLVDRLRCEQ